MNGSTIGIKIANGSYFPILKEDEKVRKKLVLTTVKDSQNSVQIDLYRGTGDTLEGASYLGSLIIENIESAKKGDPEIELILGIDKRGNLNASASDRQTGERQSLNVSLETLSPEGTYDIPDFSLDESYEPEIEGGYSSYEEEYEAHFPPKGETFDEEEFVERRERKLHPLLLIGFIIVGLAIIGLVGLLLFRSFEGPSVPPLQGDREQKSEQLAETEEVETEAATPSVEEPGKEQSQKKTPDREREKEAVSGEEEQPSQGEGAAVTPEEEQLSQGEVAEPSPPREKQQPIRESGVWYTIKWGDTLWDISASFYRTPWLFGMLARVNDIENPNLIFAGTKLYIPER